LRVKSSTKKSRRHRRRRVVVVVAGCIIALFALAVLIDSVLYYGKVHAGISVSGLSLSGLTRDEATAALTRALSDAGDDPVIVSSGSKSWKVTPAGVGAKADIATAVSAAMDLSRKSNFVVDFVRRCGLLFRGTDIPLQGTVNASAMDLIISEVALALDVPPVDAGVSIDGNRVTAFKGQKGYVVDQAALREELTARLLSLGGNELQVPMATKDPAVQAEDTQRAVVQAKTMIASPLVLREGDRTWELSPEHIAAYIDCAAEIRDGVSTLVAFLSVEKMAPLLAEIAATVNTEPTDASFASNGEQAWVIPGVSGKALDPEATAQALTKAALKTSARTTTVVTTIVQPDLTTEEAEAMGIRDRLATYTTKWEGTADRQTNVRITTEYASDVILAPGEVYDFDKQIGPRTEARGYKLAPGITKGELEDVLGGGICQVSTTLFNAAFFAGLEIVERKNHSIYIDHYPKGRDATVSAGGPNMRFRNDTEHYLLIRGKSNGITTTFNIYGTNDGRKVDFSTSAFYDEVPRATYEIPASWLGPGTTFVKISGQAGKKIKVTRTVTAKDGTVIHDDVFISEWRMITREIEVGTGSTTTTQPTSTTGTTAPSGSTTGTTKPPD